MCTHKDFYAFERALDVGRKKKTRKNVVVKLIGGPLQAWHFFKIHIKACECMERERERGRESESKRE